MGVDPNGEFLDTVFDVASLCFSIADVIAEPYNPWAWIGLAGDIVDLVPFVSGVGESAKAIGAVVERGDKVIDLAKAAKKTGNYKGVGVYEIVFKSGKNYVGKGGIDRMISSGKRILSDNKDEIASMMWKPAANNSDAFINEYLMQLSHGVLSANSKALTYNKIWSPGKKLFERLF